MHEKLIASFLRPYNEILDLNLLQFGQINSYVPVQCSSQTQSLGGPVRGAIIRGTMQSAVQSAQGR